MERHVAYIGLGKLGLPCAEVLARYHRVVGFDIARRRSSAIRMAGSIAEAVEASEIVFVAVPTPHAPAYDGSEPVNRLPPRDFDYSILKDVLGEVARYLGPAQRVVVVSTVLPGTCRRELARIVPPAKLLYSPSFVAMGSVEADFLKPDLVVIGSTAGDPESAAPLVDVYSTFLQANYQTGTWEEAEAIKIFYNTFISLKLAFVNMIQDVAVSLGHLDVDRVTAALGAAHTRIVSSAYLRAGMGDGGPCHPRDNVALRHLAQRLDLGYDLFSALLLCREKQAEKLAAFLVSYNRPVAILGKTYKPGVPYIDGSYSMLVAHFVRTHGDFAGFIDPAIGEGVAETCPLTYLLAHHGDQTHNHRFVPGSVIVDPWRACPSIPDCELVHYGARSLAVTESHAETNR